MYIKPNSSYKMPSYIKNWLGRYKDPHVRGEMKRSWIQADLESKIKPKPDKKNRDAGDE